MAQKSGKFQNFLRLIGLAEYEDEPAQESSRRVQPEDARARYGSTSSTSYSHDNRQGAGTYGSSGKAARYSKNAASFERPAKQNPRAKAIPVQQPEEDELSWDNVPARNPAPQRQQAPVRQAQQQTSRSVSSRPAGAQIRRYAMQNLDSCSEIIRAMIEGNTIFLNLDDMDDRLLQRTVDTIGGAAFALNARMCRLGSRMYLVAPVGVKFDDFDEYANID